VAPQAPPPSLGGFAPADSNPRLWTLRVRLRVPPGTPLIFYERPLAAYGAGRQPTPAGTLLVPLSSPTARRIDPLRGLRPPLPTAAAPPPVFQKTAKFGAERVFGSWVMEMYQNEICVSSRANMGPLRRDSPSGSAVLHFTMALCEPTLQPLLSQCRLLLR